jgi:hypothetical protein
VGHNLDGGGGPSETHPSVQALGDDAREPDLKKQIKGIDSSLDARDQERETVTNGMENQVRGRPFGASILVESCSPLIVGPFESQLSLE